MKFSNFITNCVDLPFGHFSIIFTVAAISNKSFDLDLPKNSDVYVLVSSSLPVRGHSWTPYTSRLGYSNFITNCVEFVF